MKRTSTIYFVISFLVPLSVLSQKSISGTLIDQETKEPIAYAHVFLSDSSKGTFSDLDGSFFLLQDKRSEAKDLIISHVGYQLKNILINKDELGQITLEAKKDQLLDVQVSGEVDKKWRKKYEQFKEELFGSTPFAEQCKILNPWVIDFNKVNGSFVATADEPIEIANDALGYRISFQLDYFTSKNIVVTIKGIPIKIRTNSASDDQVIEFEKNRQIAFEGSIYHFAQCLSNNTLRENGYEVSFIGDEFVEKKEDVRSTPDRKLYNADEILVQEANQSQFNFKEYLKVTYINPLTGIAEISWLKQEGNASINSEGIIENLDNIKLFGSFSKDRLANFLPFSQLKSYYKNQLKTSTLANQIKSNFNPIISSEKAYIHTDREVYFPGEDIWLKGYINHSSDSAKSKKLFVELVNNDSSIVQSIIPIENNEAAGYITLPNVAPGTYLIIGYTDINLDNPELHFKKPIQVGYWGVGNTNKSEKRSIVIYAEGGELISSVINNVAFEIRNQNGHRIDGKVNLYEGSKKLLSVNTEWDGRGTFKLIPKENVKYTLKNDADGISPLKFEANTKKIGVIIQDLDSVFRVNLQSNVVINDTIYLTTSQNDKLSSINPLYIYKTRQLILPKEGMDDGVNAITVFDKNINPILERVVFKQPKMADVTIMASSSNFQSIVTISGKDSIRTASFSAIDLGKSNDRGSESILVNSYLRPEIKGWVENSDQIFMDPNPNNIDLIMLTNGWRRYSKQEVANDSSTVETQNGFSLIGSVTFKNPNKSSTGNIYLINRLSENPLETNLVNEQGFFTFEDIYYTDSTSLFFTFDKKFAKNVASVRLEEVHDWQYLNGFSYTFDFTGELLNERRRISYENSLSAQETFDVSEATELEEVVVLGKEGSSLKKRRYSITSAEIMSFKEKPINGYGRNTYTTIDQFKSVRPLIYYETGGAVIRDVKLINTEIPIGARNDTFFADSGDPSSGISNEIDLFVDNNLTEPIMLLYMDPASFERIEFVRTYGKNGTLFIYTRDTPIRPPTKQVFEKKLKGYQTQKDFYTEKLVEQPSNQSATLYWDPTINNQTRSLNFSGPAVIIPVKIILEGYTQENKPFRVVRTYTSN